ncbi:hypothetical protein PBI_MORRISSEY_49 [Gordonia phage Morrissey]|nr:hypothetical protein PBI_MORRISSEY_49 [Gordonia phage Morrissey]
MARQTKAEIQAELDELLTTLKPRLEELVDIVHTMDTNGADTHNLHEEAVTNIRLLIADLVDLPAWEVLFPDGETVRNITGVYYRDLALEVAES